LIQCSNAPLIKARLADVRFVAALEGLADLTRTSPE
jgi:hypothetical protein